MNSRAWVQVILFIQTHLPSGFFLKTILTHYIVVSMLDKPKLFWRHPQYGGSCHQLNCLYAPGIPSQGLSYFMLNLDSQIKTVDKEGLRSR
jgi:hypothetical protein